MSTTYRIDIQIETTDRRLDREMLNTDYLSAREPLTIVDGVTGMWSAPLQKYAGEPYVFDLAIEAVSTVGLNLLSSWLYDKLKNRKRQNVKLRINRTVVEIELNKIRVEIEQIEKDGP